MLSALLRRLQEIPREIYWALAALTVGSLAAIIALWAGYSQLHILAYSATLVLSASLALTHDYAADVIKFSIGSLGAGGFLVWGISRFLL